MQKITIRGKEYPVHMGIGTIADIQDRYGEIGNLSEVLVDPREIPWLYAVLINDGLRVAAYELGQPARQISEADLAALVEFHEAENQANLDAIVACVNETMGPEVKNLTAGDLTQMATTIGTTIGTEDPAKEQ